jgi:hypothetical protein
MFRRSSTRTENFHFRRLARQPANRSFRHRRCWFAVLGFTFLALAFPAQSADSIPLSPPLTEVVSFGVAPVSALPSGSALKPKPGDIVYRPEPAAPQPLDETATRVQFGESWPALFSRVAGKLNAEVLSGGSLASGLDRLPPLEPGKYVRLRSIREGQALEIDYVVHPNDAYTITLAADGVQVRPRASDPRIAEKMRADPSKASLFTATDAIGLPEKIVLQLAEIFADEVDFQRELHNGYRCSLVYEVYYRDGHIDRAGRILAADFTVGDRRFQAYYYNDGAARDGYYSETGKSLKKAFRKSPVEFSRITSEYTLARFHPILGLWRAHRGIDYAAPKGSPVLATADGAVEFVGDRGELGNLVILRHYGRFLTYYGHLNAFAENLAAGSKVRKGQLIGFVGMTGLATGPHLHYEFRIDDGSANGLGIPVPPPDVLEEPPVHSEAFLGAVERYRAQFQAAQRAHVVVLE